MLPRPLIALSALLVAAGPAVAREPVAAATEETLRPEAVLEAPAPAVLPGTGVEPDLLRPRLFIAGFTLEPPPASVRPRFEVCGPEVTFSIRFGRPRTVTPPQTAPHD